MTGAMKGWVIAGLAILALIGVATLTHGVTPISDIVADLTARWNGSGDSWNPLLHERLPRLLVLAMTGASLAVAGAVMQALFQNPLASPGILGVSAGGSLAVVLLFLTGWHIGYPFVIPFGAFAGSLCTLFAVYWVSHWHGRLQLHHLILAGIAISTAVLAIKGAIIYGLRDNWQLIQTVTEWEAGSTHDRGWQHVNMQLPLAMLGLIGSLYYKQEINILALGEEEAYNLGVDVETVRLRLFLCVAMLTGGAMAALGLITFFGLILPHVLRRFTGPDHRALLPACTVFGATTLAALDLMLRVFHIHWLSIGNVSAVLGGLFFVALLFGQLRNPSYA